MHNNGNGFLSHCEARITSITPGPLQAPRALGQGAITIHQGQKEPLDVAYQHQSVLDEFFICGPIGFGFGGGIMKVPSRSYIIGIKATADESKEVEAFVEIYADSDGKLRIKPA